MALNKIVTSRNKKRTTVIPFPGTVDDGSTLNLDFTAMGNLDSRFTFSRSSTATVINSSGLVQYAAANLMTFSEDQGNNTTWSAFGTSVTRLASQSDPLGGSSAIRLSFDATSSDAVISRTVSVNNGLPYVISIWMRSDSGTVTNVRFARSDSAAGAIFPTLTTAWQRVELPFTASSASSGIEIRVLASGSPKTATIHVFGAQLEPGSVMRSYQPATGGTAYHAPRFDYDPTTLAARGLLIEASATNICTRSEDFANAVWVADNGSATNPSVSVVSQAAPNGGSSVNRITFNKTGGTFSRIRQTLVGTSGATYTFSVWMKANTANGAAATQNVGLRIGADTGGFNCAVTTTWTRFWYSYALSGTDASAQIMLWDNISGNDETADVLVWGAQIEASSGASSYIPTGASTVQRAADVCTMSGTNFSSWFNSAQGTFLAAGERGILSNFGRLLSANANNTGSAFDLGASANGRWRIHNTTLQADIMAGTVTANTAFKVAGAFASNDAQMAFNGTLGTADTIVSLPTVSQLDIGADRTAVYLNGCIRGIKFWPTRLPDATLQSLTQ